MAVYTGAPAQLTVRAFDIATGDLKARFVASVGATGSTTFDLNAVAGLADNGQYAVTIDGGGPPLAVVALERASSGGDAFMAFEGFGTDALGSALVPASMRVSRAPSSITTTWTQQFTVSVKDQFGGAMPEQPVAYALSSPTLGTVSGSGLFTAGAGAGTGTLLVAAGQVTTRVPLTVTLPQVAAIAGTSFWQFSAGLAEVYVETAVGLGKTQAIATQVDSDVQQIQKDYTRTYAGRPVVYALSNAASFQRAVRVIGGSTSETPTWAAGLCICRAPHPDWVFVDWDAASDASQITTIRHELTHVIEHQLAPDAALPSWFDEGNARLEEFTVANTQWWSTLQRYMAVSMAHNRKLFTLFELDSGFDWSRRTSTEASYEYAESSQVVQIVRSDLGMSTELLIFDLMRQGRTFAEAFDFVGPSVGLFDVTLERRIGALAPEQFGIATAQDTQAGAGLTFIVYGLPPNTSFTLSISGADQSSPVLRTADAYGIYYSYLGDQWRPGQYTFSATWAGGTITGTGTKLS